MFEYSKISFKTIFNWRKLHNQAIDRAFIDFLKIHGYVVQELKHIPCTCCSNSSLNVLDFDKIKDDLSMKLGINDANKLQSMDAILLKGKKLSLVEMKSYRNYSSNPTNSGKTIQDFINHYLSPSEIPSKKVDTLLLLLGVLGYYKAPKHLFNFLLNKSGAEIKSFFLTDATAVEMTRLVLATLPITVSTKRVHAAISIINCNDLGRFFPA